VVTKKNAASRKMVKWVLAEICGLLREDGTRGWTGSGGSRCISEGGGHFLEDGFGGGGGVGGLGNGAADDEVTGALAKGFRGGGNAALVADLGAGGADARNDEDAFRAGKSAEGGDLLGGADESADSGSQAHAGQQFHLFCWRTIKADSADLDLIHAGEHGDGEQFRGIGQSIERGTGSSEHGGATAGVDIEHVDSQAGCGANGSCDGVGDVVKFQVEKDLVATFEDGFKDRGSNGSEQFHAYFEPDAGAMQPLDELGGGGGVGHVEGYNEPRACLFQGVGPTDCNFPRGGECGVQTLWNRHTSILRQFRSFRSENHEISHPGPKAKTRHGWGAQFPVGMRGGQAWAAMRSGLAAAWRLAWSCAGRKRQR